MAAISSSQVFGLLLILFFSSRCPISTLSINDFFPFGPENEDNQLRDGDDEVEVEFFRGLFQFYGQLYQLFSVSTNGFLLLYTTDDTSGNVPPRTSDEAIIAPYWADADTSGIGNVYYRCTMDQPLLQQMQQVISMAFPGQSNFFPDHLCIITWFEVGYYNNHTDKNNTFQSVLAANNDSSYVLFLYKDGGIQWTTGDLNGGAQGLGGNSATVGLSAGDMVLTVTGSDTADVINISSTSNVGLPGLWVFQVSQAQQSANITEINIPDGFLPFGPSYGDSVIPKTNDTSSEEISLKTDVVIFGSHHNRLYVNTNGVLSFGQSYSNTSADGLNFGSVLSPPIIAPFWDGINVTSGGAIYYRQDIDENIAAQLSASLSAQFPNVELEFLGFYPSLVFIATWYSVESSNISSSGLVNTFQIVVISNGLRTFVKFIYGDIQWGGSTTLIGVSAGDGFNFITSPNSLSSDVKSLANTNFTYQIDSMISNTGCVDDGMIIPYLTTAFVENASHNATGGDFEICIGGFYGSVCDIGWDQGDALTVCNAILGSNYVSEPLYGLGYPRRRYVAHSYNCSMTNATINECSYNSSIISECYSGPHVAGVRCTQSSPTTSVLSEGLSPTATVVSTTISRSSPMSVTSDSSTSIIHTSQSTTSIMLRTSHATDRTQSSSISTTDDRTFISTTAFIFTNDSLLSATKFMSMSTVATTNLISKSISILLTPTHTTRSLSPPATVVTTTDSRSSQNDTDGNPTSSTTNDLTSNRILSPASTKLLTSSPTADMATTVSIVSTQDVNTEATSKSTQTINTMSIPRILITHSVSGQTVVENLTSSIIPDGGNTTDTVESFFETNKWAFISVFVVVGLVSLLLVPGAVCGYIKISKPIYETLTSS